MINNLLKRQLKLKRTKRTIRKIAEASGDLIGNNIADKFTKVSRTLPQNSSDKVKSEAENIRLDTEIPKERYIFPERRQKIIDDLRLI